MISGVAFVRKATHVVSEIAQTSVPPEQRGRRCTRNYDDRTTSILSLSVRRKNTGCKPPLATHRGLLLCYVHFTGTVTARKTLRTSGIFSRSGRAKVARFIFLTMRRRVWRVKSHKDLFPRNRGDENWIARPVTSPTARRFVLSSLSVTKMSAANSPVTLATRRRHQILLCVHIIKLRWKLNV